MHCMHRALNFDRKVIRRIEVKIPLRCGQPTVAKAPEGQSFDEQHSSKMDYLEDTGIFALLLLGCPAS